VLGIMYFNMHADVSEQYNKDLKNKLTPIVGAGFRF
jgi:hypothetical protein